MNLWFVGVAIYVGGAVAMALGINLQKLSMMRESETLEEDRRRKWKQPLWLVGVTLYTSSGVMLSAALGFAAQALLSPLMSVVLISNALLGHFLLKEDFGRRDFLATCVIVVAVTVTTIFAPHTEEQYLASQLKAMYGEIPFIVFAVVIVVSLICLYLLNRHLLPQLALLRASTPLITPEVSNAPLLKESSNSIRRPSDADALDIVDCSVSRRMSDVGAQADPETLERVSRLLPFSYGALAGIFGGFCSCMMKSAISVIVQEVKYTGFVGMLGTWLIYPLIVLLAGSWIGQLMWINRGVEHFPAVYIVAVEAVINEITGVIGGLLYFQEYRSMSDLNLGLFLLGLLIGVGGVLILATQKRPPNKSTTIRTPSKQVA